jgi:hypothetical protein
LSYGPVSGARSYTAVSSDAQIAMKITTEKADFVVRVLTFLALAIGGAWAIYQYELTGATDWTNNLSLETKVMPYHDDLRLLVVHVRSKNPRNVGFELDTKKNDSFELRIRKFPDDAKANKVIDEDSGDIIASADLMEGTGGEYLLLPGAETDDMRTIVLPAKTTINVTAEMKIHNGTLDAQGKPDFDSLSVSSVVRIEP